MINQTREQRIAKYQKNKNPNLVVVLEDIYDPHNAAAIFRSCDGFGVSKAYLVFDQQTSFNPKQVGKKSSATANKWLDFQIYTKTDYENPLKACIKGLKEQGFKIVGTVLDKQAKDIYTFAWPKKTALLVGNEKLGLSKAAIELSDYHIYIPMLGMVQSLNVSVATAICLSEIFRTTSHP